VETSPAAILILDRQGQILQANESAQRLLAVRAEPLVRKHVAEFLPDLNRAARASNPRQFRTVMQCQGVRADGTRFVAEAWFSTYMAGSEPRLAAILVDLADENDSESGVGHERILEKLESLSCDLKRMGESMALITGQIANQNGKLETLPATDENGHSEATFQGMRLTEREVEVLRLVFEGLTNKEIAGRLNLSETTVKGTLQQLFAKAEVRTRSQLVRVALDQFRNYLND
jgi:PAS domain S-box-containing protein